jgi:hypothetical protein
MQYMRSVQFIFDRQNWMTNILLAGVCMLVPIAGPMVLSGYLFEVIDALRLNAERQEYPDFDANRLMDYLTRGDWPIVMQLVLSLIIGVPLGLIAAVLMIGGVAIAAATKTPAWVPVFQFAMFLLIMIVTLLTMFVTMPAELHAGLAREFNFGGMMTFVRDFNKRVFRELALSILFIMAAIFVAEFVGMLLFCVGIYFTLAAVVMSQYHLKFQLYELYLERGGTAVIPAKGAWRRPGPPSDSAYPDEPEEAVEPDEPDERFRGGDEQFSPRRP